MKTFDQLVTIKKFREEKAERAMRAQRRALDDAVARRDAAQRTLDEYRAYAESEERRVYARLCERPVLLREIDDVRGQVLLLREREADHRDDLGAAEAKRVHEERQLDDDRQTHRLALRMRDKFIELASTFAQEALAQAERKEEAEIEEAAETRHPGTRAQEQFA